VNIDVKRPTVNLVEAALPDGTTYVFQWVGTNPRGSYPFEAVHPAPAQVGAAAAEHLNRTSPRWTWARGADGVCVGLVYRPEE
jgi:hypothetical protein